MKVCSFVDVFGCVAKVSVLLKRMGIFFNLVGARKGVSRGVILMI